MRPNAFVEKMTMPDAMLTAQPCGSIRRMSAG